MNRYVGIILIDTDDEDYYIVMRMSALIANYEWWEGGDDPEEHCEACDGRPVPCRHHLRVRIPHEQRREEDQ